MVPALVSLAGGAAAQFLGSAGAGALDAAKERYYVVWVKRGTRDLVSKEATDLQEAVVHQQNLAERKGISSIIVVKQGRTWNCRHPVRGMIATKKGGVPVAVHAPTAKVAPAKPAPGGGGKKKFRVGQRTYGQGGGRGDDFDSMEEMQNMRELTTDHPTSPWAVQAKKGPYFETGPLYDDTPSSHMFLVDVPRVVVPERFTSGTSFRQR